MFVHFIFKFRYNLFRFNLKYQSTFDFLYEIFIYLQWNVYFYVFIMIIEFMLGEQILVAPVLVEGATTRNIYLPTGLWRDENHPGNSLLSGRTWLVNYPASLEVLPWFTRVSPDSQPEPSSSVCHNNMSYTSCIIVLCVIAYFFRFNTWFTGL